MISLAHPVNIRNAGVSDYMDFAGVSAIPSPRIEHRLVTAGCPV